MKEYLIILITTPSGDVAQTIARTLVEDKLAACVNIIPAITSVYTWKGTIEQETEDLLVVKTRAENLNPLTTKEISSSTGITKHYLNQLLFKLRKKNIIRSLRGPGGGYMLARPADEITLLDIIVAVEDSIIPVWCVHPRADKHCEKEMNCPSRDVWLELRSLLTEFFKSITLQDLTKGTLVSREVAE